MQKYVRIENGSVVECVDSLPLNPVGEWRQAIEIAPTLVPNRQITGSHYFEIDKNPVEIKWNIIELTVEERKNQLTSDLNSRSYRIVYDELIKEFNGQDSNFSFVQAAISVYRAKKIEINLLSSHEDIDNYIAINPWE